MPPCVSSTIGAWPSWASWPSSDRRIATLPASEVLSFCIDIALADPGQRLAAIGQAGQLDRRLEYFQLFHAQNHLDAAPLIILSLIHISEPTRLLSISYAV